MVKIDCEYCEKAGTHPFLVPMFDLDTPEGRRRYEGHVVLHHPLQAHPEKRIAIEKRKNEEEKKIEISNISDLLEG